MSIASTSNSDGAPVVAVLDDDQTLSMVVCRVLRACGLHADPFVDVDSLDAALEFRRYDAFVLDWQLADVTTQGVIRDLRESDYPDCPIFLYSGQPTVDDVPVESAILTTLDRYRVQFRQKPYSLRALATEIQRALEEDGPAIRPPSEDER